MSKPKVGSKMYALWEKRLPHVTTPCPFCTGTGKITGANKATATCPECDGDGHTTSQPTKWQVFQFKVSAVAEVSNGKATLNFVFADEPIAKFDAARLEGLMGILEAAPVGPFIDGRNAWRTEKEADKFADQANAGEFNPDTPTLAVSTYAGLAQAWRFSDRMAALLRAHVEAHHDAVNRSYRHHRTNVIKLTGRTRKPRKQAR